MLDLLTQLNAMGWTNILTIVVLLFVLIAEFEKVADMVCKFLNRIGIQITTQHQRRDTAQEQEIASLKQKLESYQDTTTNRETEWHQQSIDIRNGLLTNQQKLELTMDKISSSLATLDKRILDEQIKRMRWRILDFSDSLSNGNSASLEQFNNIIETHTEYEQVLHDNNMTNGLVSASYEFILKKYQELLHAHSEEE